MTESDSMDKEQSAWKEHNLSQLRHFRSLPLRDKILALEELQKTLERLQAMRQEQAEQKKRDNSNLG